jgi:hypothetical protein
MIELSIILVLVCVVGCLLAIPVSIALLLAYDLCSNRRSSASEQDPTSQKLCESSTTCCALFFRRVQFDWRGYKGTKCGVCSRIWSLGRASSPRLRRTLRPLRRPRLLGVRNRGSYARLGHPTFWNMIVLLHLCRWAMLLSSKQVRPAPVCTPYDESLGDELQAKWDKTPLRGFKRRGKRLPRQNATNSGRHLRDSHGLRGRRSRLLKPVMIAEIPFEEYDIVS